jgi:hypothetical protein
MGGDGSTCIPGMRRMRILTNSNDVDASGKKAEAGQRRQVKWH